MRRFLPLLMLVATLVALAQVNPAPKPSGDNQTIQQLEADFLQAEMTTDPLAIDRIFADDWISLTPNGTAPSKAAISNAIVRTGQAPPYTARQQSMLVFV